MAENGPVKLRSYQQEMLEASLNRNVIVAMDTGSGKTHVAVFRILAELEISQPTKLVWFMSPSVALSMQQHEVLKNNLPGYLVKSLTGSDGVDKWTEQRLWDAVLTNVRVVVGTPAVLADALTHGFVRMSRLALLVFDEAHRCIKGSQMNTVMKNFYHPAKRRGESVPGILGLTASPVMSAKSGTLETVEANLDAVTTTPKLHRSDLDLYVHPPDITSVIYDVQPVDEVPPTCRRLWTALESYDISSDPYAIRLKEANDQTALKKLAIKPDTYCYSQLKMLKQRSEALLQQLGPSAADWYLMKCIERFHEGMNPGALTISDIVSQEKQHLSSMLAEIANSTPQSSVNAPPKVTPKVQSLGSFLLQQYTPSARGIIFAEQRAVVTILASLLRADPTLNSHYSIGCFVGTSTYTARKSNLADFVDLKRQQQDMEDFRSGKINLMITTNVWEEGIDVPACNLVICFEPPTNLVSFIQRRGRARQRDSKYVMFFSADDPQAKSGKWQKLETQMKEAYMNGSRALLSVQVDDEDAVNSKVYLVKSTGALLTLDNAKAHLHHFCSVSVSNSIDPRPEFDTDETMQDNGEVLYTAQVTLPSFVHPDLRTASSSQTWKSEDAAIRDASFQAYVALHKEGLVNNHLLPLTRNYGPELGQQHVDQPSLLDTAERVSSWTTLFESTPYNTATWYPAALSIHSSNKLVLTINIWLPTRLCEIDTFNLYWNEETTYRVSIQNLDNPSMPGTSQAVHDMRNFTRAMLRSVHGNRMTTDANDFPILFSDGDVANSKAKHKAVKECVPASDLALNNLGSFDCGLIRVRGFMDKAFIFSNITQSDAMSDDCNQREVVVTPFPRRQDFLHPVQNQEDGKVIHTTKHSFPIRDCTVDPLPAIYALLAAFVPSIMHRIDVALLVERLQSTILQDISIQNVSLLAEAITAPAAGEARDYNRLEFLGDTILKFCTVLQVMSQHLNWPEGYLTLEKGRIVSNNSLKIAALLMGLDKYILTKHFTGVKWRPVYVSELRSNNEQPQRTMSSKVLADVVEALIGAAFVDCGMDKAMSCLRTFLPNENWQSHQDSIDRLVGELKPRRQTEFGLLEKLIGHRFNNPSLLREAMTHSSFPHNKGGLSYERLEFLGDAVLDLIVVPKLFAHSRNLRHWELHQIRQALANGHFLAYCCMSYAVEEDNFSVVEELAGARHIKKSARQVYLHDFLRAGAATILAKQRSLAAFEDHRLRIGRALEYGSEYPWPSLIAMQAPKFLSDIVESVLGALYLDTKGDLAVCEEFVEKLGILRHMRRILDEEAETLSPKERLGIAAGNEVVTYLNEVNEDAGGRKTFGCKVEVGFIEVTSVSGCGSKDEAEVTVAHAAARMLEARVGAGNRKRKLEVDAGGDIVLNHLDRAHEGEDTEEGGVML